MITATENSGLPIIGRMASRSINKPEQGGEDQRDDDDSTQAIHVGPPMSVIGFVERR